MSEVPHIEVLIFCAHQQRDHRVLFGSRHAGDFQLLNDVLHEGAGSFQALQKLRFAHQFAVRAPEKQLVGQQLREEPLRRTTTPLLHHREGLIKRDEIRFHLHDCYIALSAPRTFAATQERSTQQPGAEQQQCSWFRRDDNLKITRQQ